jgi:hypothetical protein
MNIKNKYIQYVFIGIVLIMATILIYDFFIKRHCTLHVVQNHYFDSGSEEHSSHYRYPYRKSDFEYNKGHQKFNTLTDAEKYCFAKKKLF